MKTFITFCHVIVKLCISVSSRCLVSFILFYIITHVLKCAPSPVQTYQEDMRIHCPCKVCVWMLIAGWRNAFFFFFTFPFTLLFLLSAREFSLSLLSMIVSVTLQNQFLSFIFQNDFHYRENTVLYSLYSVGSNKIYCICYMQCLTWALYTMPKSCTQIVIFIGFVSVFYILSTSPT